MKLIPAIFVSICVGVAVACVVALAGCSNESASNDTAPPMTDAALATAAGVQPEVIAIVRAAGGENLAALPGPEGGAAPAGLRFEVLMRNGIPPLRPLLNDRLTSHGCRVYVIDMTARDSPRGKPQDVVVFAALPSRDPFAPLRLMRTTLTARQDTEGLIEALRTLSERVPLDVVGAGRQFVNIQFLGPSFPEWGALAKDIFERFPDAAKRWWVSPEALAAEMEKCRCLDLAMD